MRDVHQERIYTRVDDHGATEQWEADHTEWDGAESKKAAHNDQP